MISSGSIGYSKSFAQDRIFVNATKQIESSFSFMLQILLTYNEKFALQVLYTFPRNLSTIRECISSLLIFIGSSL